MTPSECAEFLAKYNEWRRCDPDDEDSGKIVMPHPRELGIAIDEAIKLIKQRAKLADIETLEQENRQMRARMERLEGERDCLLSLLSSYKNNVLFKIGTGSPYRQVAKDYNERIKQAIAKVQP